MSEKIQPIVWRSDRTLALLDQRLLPHREEHVICSTPADVADAIRTMVVRGAPAIGVTAAFGLVLARPDELDEAAELLRSTRPTARNLFWAIERMMRVARQSSHLPPSELQSLLETEAQAIFQEDLAANRRIGELGRSLLPHAPTILTHCNAGALATSGYGTALGVIRAANEAGMEPRVFAGETRPFLQGARLTAWELLKEGIDVTLITDNMAGHFFGQDTFDAVVVGADRIARNGDTANKIGTYTLALLAAAHNVPFYVAAPFSTVDLDCTSGEEIPIEERSAAEVVEARGTDEAGATHALRIAPAGIKVRHPAFDVTPSHLITAIITERGVATAPFEESLTTLGPA